MLTSLHFTETMPQQLTTYVHTLCTVHRKHDFALTLSQKDNPNLYLKVSEKTPVCKRPYRHGLCWGGKGWFNHVSVSRHSFKNHCLLLCFCFYSVSRTSISTFGLPVPLPFPSYTSVSLLSMLCSASQLLLWSFHVCRASIFRPASIVCFLCQLGYL